MDNPLLKPAGTAAAAQPTGGAPTAAADKLQKAREAAQEFEALFLAQMMAPMFAGIESGGPFGGGEGEAPFREMLTQEYGKVIAKAGGVGIADAVVREILRQQEVE